jgi:GNAT superfamily N-acetyltransferase
VTRSDDVDITYRVSPPVANEALDRLFGASWPNHTPGDFQKVLQRSLAYVCAYDGGRLIGFANLAWDGGAHAFLLDPTVDPAFRRRGIGRRLVEEAVAAARNRGLEWVHVDFEPELEGFYRGCGFRPTLAGLIRLDERGA